ncbi:STAS domain-containing protein [Alkalihalophilus lindianensis]|uniref:STAS domain-containing protein n=1 Tax=Alkalihalophilus lindianensis TaxID=1630542 RepID=A0ABU3X987_9BACI|nr:STAS domain-containing protein [Alkalihalophilus lindianensis]MDV2684457.1 STAS domain-containing protein [Alkalihalophilus lindianensis]
MSNEVQLREEIEQLRETIRKNEIVIADLSAPIIPSIIPSTILVPLTGALTNERFSSIQTKILTRIQTEKADTVIIDFTAITYREIDQLGMEHLGDWITQLRDSLRLMGVETIFTGFSSGLVQEMVKSNIDTSQFVVHSTFRTGLQYLMKKKGLEFVQVQPN